MPAPSDPVPNLLSRSDVAQLLGVPLRTLTWWVWALDDSKRYTSFDIQRRDGRPRTIQAPIKPIKDLQRTLAGHLVRWYSPPPHVHGFVPGRSPTSNAARHQNQEWVLRIDLEDFFPSINFGRVRGVFLSFPFDFPPQVATLLAQVCCHGNELPQGAPTSPIVSNLICRGMDKQLAELARDERCYYTRYADDLVFSTDRTSFPPTLGATDHGTTTPGGKLEQIIASNGFRINPAKSRLSHRTQRQRVTGLVVNEQINVPRNYVRDLRNLLHIWKCHGEDDAKVAFARLHQPENWPLGKPPPDFKLVVRGRIQYVGSIKGWTSSVYRGLATSLAQLDPTFHPSEAPALHEPQKVLVYTEGPTDAMHLANALSAFQTNGEFSNLTLVFENNDLGDGAPALLRKLQDLPKEQNDLPTVCIFDRDDDKRITGAGLDKRPWEDWGNGVAAVGLATPDFRTGPVCIEMLYGDADLQRRDVDGRRLYLLSEFDRQSGHHHDGSCNIANVKNDTLVPSEVFDFKTGDQMALSKKRFAEHVAQGSPEFASVSVEGFRETFRVLEEAVTVIRTKIETT